MEVVCWLAAAVVGLSLLAGAIDFGFRITDRGLRLLLSAALLAMVGYSAWRLGRGWQTRRWSPLVAAQRVQAAYPQLGDRLASALEFLSQDEDDPSAGSAPLRRSVIAGTSATLHELPLSEVTKSPSLRKATMAMVATLIAALGLVIANPSAVRIAIARVTAPWNNVEWPRQNNLAFVDPPQVVGRGETFEVSLVDESGDMPSEIHIEYRYRVDGRRRTDEARMQRVGDRAVARRENVQRPFEYRAVGGDHRTMAWNEVHVVNPPALEKMTLRLHPPKYSGLPSSVAKGRLQILSGTRIEIAGRANEPLREALVEVAGSDGIACQIRGDSRRDLSLAPDAWELLANKGNRYTRFHLRLVADNGLIATTSPTNVHLQEDQAPTVDWSDPTKDEWVVATALLPIGIVVADDLAIASADLFVLAQAKTDESRRAGEPQRISLFRGETKPPARSILPREGQSLDRRTWEHPLDLTPHGLVPGAVIEVRAKATDYRGAVGATASVCRLTIVTQAEIESRIATDQAEILRRLEQALADQRSARSESARMAVETLAPNFPRQTALDRLLATRLTQQNVRRRLTADQQGAIDLARQLLQKIVINRLERPELVSQLENIVGKVGDLAAGPLPDAEGQLTDLRKRVASLGESLANGVATSMEGSFAKLQEAQVEILATLETLIHAAAKWSDADRFIRELVRLEQEQRGLRTATAEAARQQIKSLADPNTNGVDRATVDHLAGEQADLARRFNKLTQAMRQMANQEQTSSEWTDRLNDALTEAQANNLGGQMAEGAREIERKQLGRAGDRQAGVADKLRDLIDLLRDQRPTDPKELANRLRELQKELASLQADATQITQNDAAQNGRQPEQNEQRRKLAEKLERLARQMNRMTAPSAGRSTQSAATQASPLPQESTSEVQEGMQEAQKQMEQAQQQLAQRIAELEDEQQQRLLERLAQVLDDLIPRQQKVLEETLQLEHPGEDVLQHAGQHARDLSPTEATIANDLDEAILDLAQRAIFQLALESAAADMRQASEALKKNDTGRITQELERGALSRMRHVLEVLRDLPPAPDEKPQQNGGGGGGQGKPKPPLIELAEIKMLRWLQVDLNGRTRRHEADLADNLPTTASKKQIAERLAKEQSRLEELVRQMMRRDPRTDPAEINL